MLHMGTADDYGGTAATNALPFRLDPDAKVTDGTTNGPGKSINFWIYYDGKIRTYGTIESNTCYEFGCFNPNTALDPPWFNWN